MTQFADRAVTVSVPATSANLGPGFDSLGLALGLHDEVTGSVTASGLRVDVRGEGGDTGDPVARDETHLVVRAMRAAFDAMEVAPPGLAVDCLNRIPHSRGLGSSAAAIVAGALLARALVTDGAQRLPAPDLLSLASEIEGHPDNVAPCLLGGLTIAWTEDAGAPGPATARAVRRDVDPRIVPVAFVPAFTSSTELARGLLPERIAHGDAAFAAGRAALLVAALSGAPAALFAATEDRLHQAYRAPAMPDSARLLSRLRAAGYPAVISGAGPTVLVLARGEVEAKAVSAAAPAGWWVLTAGIDLVGARILGTGASAPDKRRGNTPDGSGVAGGSGSV